jgi:glycosyltransferase involved in cell wall biosynthesis
MKKNKIECFIPVYNGVGTIVPCLESVLFQTHSFDRIVIIDDGSTDDTIPLLESYIAEQQLQEKVILLRNKTNEGLSKVRNQAMDRSESEYLVMIDADIALASTWLEQMLSYLEKHPSVAFLGSNIQECYTNGFVNKWKKKFMTQSYGNQEVGRVPFVFGAAFLVVQEKVRSLRFPTEYKNNAEDVFFSKQLKDYGCGYAPDAHAYHMKRFTSLVDIYNTYYQWTKHEKSNQSFPQKLMQNVRIIHHLNTKTKNPFYWLFNYTLYPIFTLKDVISE